jgi:arginyl-tRNA synthetase
MQTIQSEIADNTAKIIQTLYHIDIPASSVVVQETPATFEGDFTIVMFPFLKISRKSPQQTGEEIGNSLTEAMHSIAAYSIVKGYLNVTLTDQYWVDFICKTWDNEHFGLKLPSADAALVLVEFSSPNTNKPLHLGHIRNNLLGFAVCSMLEAAGHQVLRVNLVNDRGIHICKSMIGWMKFGKGLTPELAGNKGDRFVGDYYVAFDKAYKQEIASYMEQGLGQKEAEEKSQLMHEARNLLKMWEEGEERTRNMWQQMNAWVYEGFEVTYRRLGISFDKTYYESDTYLDGKRIVLDGVDKGLLERRGDGSVWIDLKEQGMDEKLLLRSDGTSVYMTQDLGTAVIRDQEYHPEKMIYVVGNEQNYHFDVLKKVLRTLGYPAAEKISHLSYGMVELPSGKMKSREGTVVDADDLMDEMEATARRVTAELGKWSEEELEQLDGLFEMIGAGALKYFILKVDPRKNMLFNPDESIDFNGNTGPFIQYTHARIASLLRKAGAGSAEYLNSEAFPGYVPEQEERALIRLLYRWPQILEEASIALNPADIANYCYELARSFNHFYHHCSVLNADQPDTIAFRLKLSAFTGAILRTGMGLLGIALPDKM